MGGAPHNGLGVDVAVDGEAAVVAVRTASFPTGMLVRVGRIFVAVGNSSEGPSG